MAIMPAFIPDMSHWDPAAFQWPTGNPTDRKKICCRNCGEMVTHEIIGWRNDGPKKPVGRGFFVRMEPTTIPVWACLICRCEVSPDLNERGF